MVRDDVSMGFVRGRGFTAPTADADQGRETVRQFVIVSRGDGPEPIVIRVYENGALVSEVPMSALALAHHAEQCVGALASYVRGAATAPKSA